MLQGTVGPLGPERDHKGKIIKLAGGGLFYEFEWMPDSFSNFLDSKRRDKEESDKVVEELHGKQPFVTVHNSATLKHENPFNESK